jgi:hypothetical protein
MRHDRKFRTFLGIVAVILAGLSSVGILGGFLIPKGNGSIAQQLSESVLFAAGSAIVAGGFACLARWCFTGRGFKRRSD